MCALHQSAMFSPRSPSSSLILNPLFSGIPQTAQRLQLALFGSPKFVDARRDVLVIPPIAGGEQHLLVDRTDVTVVEAELAHA